MTRPDEPFITAEEAIFEIDLATHNMREGSGHIGRMEGDEARKLAEYLFADEDGMPEEMRRFFEFPEKP